MSVTRPSRAGEVPARHAIPYEDTEAGRAAQAARVAAHAARVQVDMLDAPYEPGADRVVQGVDDDVYAESLEYKRIWRILNTHHEKDERDERDYERIQREQHNARQRKRYSLMSPEAKAARIADKRRRRAARRKENR